MKTRRKPENVSACPSADSTAAKLLPFIELLAAQIAREEFEKRKERAAGGSAIAADQAGN